MAASVIVIIQYQFHRLCNQNVVHAVYLAQVVQKEIKENESRNSNFRKWNRPI